MDASKALSDFLRKNYQLGASHAREVAAAILGFKSHAAYLNAVRTESWQLPDVQTFAPDVSLVRARLRSLSGLPELPDAELLTTAAINQLRMLRLESGLHIHEVCFLGRQDEPETIHSKKHPKAGQLFGSTLEKIFRLITTSCFMGKTLHWKTGQIESALTG